jgi:GTP-binding protein
MSVEEYSVKDPEFVKSSAKRQECPKADRPEYAFIGRSNVGKSSLINMLTGRKALAKTSSTPGKTQLLNHFSMSTAGKEWYLVDLPGIGYAKVSKKDRASWERTSREYLTKRENLMCIMMLIDSRLPPQKIDLDFMVWMAEHGLSFAMIFTKVDKLTIAEREAFLPRYKERMLKQWSAMPPHFVTSAEKGDGRQEVLGFIAQTNPIYRKPPEEEV